MADIYTKKILWPISLFTKIFSDQELRRKFIETCQTKLQRRNYNLHHAK